MNKFNFKKAIILVLMLGFLVGCRKADENDDVLAQEEISNVILQVKDDATGVAKTYNYTLNTLSDPKVQLASGKTYTVNVMFKSGNEDITGEIIDERDDHFIVFEMINVDVVLTRVDQDVRSDGKRVGITSKWEVKQANTGSQPKIVINLIHDAASVDEAHSGSAWGIVQGGETDAVAKFDIIN